MTYKTETDVMGRIQGHLDYALEQYPGIDWFVIVCQGSWNYGMADEESDVDTKMLTIPSMKELVLNTKPMNKVLEVPPTEEHCDMKDVREYFKIFRKQNINFVEILFSDYYIVNPKYKDLWDRLRDNAEGLARMNEYAAVSCMCGMASEKVHALCHEYPSRMPWIEKYGYDPKQLSHLRRIQYFIRAYICGYDYKDCIFPQAKEYRKELLECKRNGNGRTKEEAIECANAVFEDIHFLANAARGKDSWGVTSGGEPGLVYENRIDPDMDALLDDTIYELMIRSLKEELK